jgi:predicted RNA methylase
MGCFLLIDWIVHIQEQLNHTVVLEIGAGTGLAAIAASFLTAVGRIYCTGTIISQHSMHMHIHITRTCILNRGSAINQYMSHARL